MINKFVVLDTNILVSALWSRDGNPAAIMRMVTNGLITACYNREITEEYKDVLFRDRFKARFSHDEINMLLKYIAKFGRYIYDVQKSIIQLPDESDRVFYDVARSCGAILVTGNTAHYPAEGFVMKPADYAVIYGQFL
jgi:putative PIN family toxin of toxin-antitoxin system